MSRNWDKLKHRKNRPEGRPLKKIDWEKVDKMLEAGCLGTEIAGYFNMHSDTFYDRLRIEKGVGFSEYRDRKHQKRNSLLRMKQFQQAMTGNTSLLIWLGKQHLEQADEHKHAHQITIKSVSYKEAYEQLEKKAESIENKPLELKSVEQVIEPEPVKEAVNVVIKKDWCGSG